MAGSIRGITIEINGDTTGLNNALKDVNSSVRSTQSELKTLNRDLKFNPDSFTLASQKADVLTKTVDSLKNKLGTLRDAQSQVDRQFKDGKIGADQYRAFQREVVETNSKLRNYQEQLKSVQSTTSGLNGAVNRIKDSFSQLKNASSGGNELSSSFKGSGQVQMKRVSLLEIWGTLLKGLLSGRL
ncbi:hypothetical protein Q757_06585 [Oenococcus alcoholitolerans]|uniref:Uncharacterized protein n=1 Tax=Oenococcus alcoholitolerans TaxID=931074 RepID=A0ABR4XQC8_9LACO|nr:hypothetical protein Q757_06585 [Oenococcus alcoholitolerans]